MTFAKDIGIAFVVFALVGVLHAAGVLSDHVIFVIHSSTFFAVFAYAIALGMRGGFKTRPLGSRLRSLGSAWLTLGIGAVLGAEGLLLIAVFIAAVVAARHFLPPISANA